MLRALAAATINLALIGVAPAAQAQPGGYYADADNLCKYMKPDPVAPDRSTR